VDDLSGAAIAGVVEKMAAIVKAMLEQRGFMNFLVRAQSRLSENGNLRHCVGTGKLS
jgi:Ethanolamine utilization protein EutJ (predicted chaperonin)